MDNVVINITEQPNNVTINIIEGGFDSFNCSDLDDCVNFQAVVSDLSNHISDNGNPHNVTKSQVGLSNVDNTSDVNKPVSTAQQTALNLKENVANKVANYNAPDNVTFATTQATVSLVDNRVQSNIKIIGDWDASSGSYPQADESNTTAFIVQWGATIKAGWAFRVGYGQQGTVGGFEYDNGDVIYSLVDSPTNSASDWGDLDHNLQQATESLRGTAKIAPASTVSDETTTENEKFVTSFRLWNSFWTRVLAMTHTFAARITFTSAPRFSSVTASQVLTVDANKDLTSEAKGTAYNKNFGTGTTNVPEIGTTLTADKVLITDANSKLKPSTISTTQLSYLDATSSIQTQLDGKVNTSDRKGTDYFLKIGAATFDLRYSTNATAFTSTTQAIGKDAMVAFPFIIEETMTFDRIGAEITAAVASGVCSLLIYDSVNNVPTNLVLDAGTISVASATYQEISINKQLTAGLYFLVLWHNGSATPSFRAMPIAACNKVLGLPSTLGTGNTYTRIFNSKVYTTAPLTYDLTGFTIFGGHNPIISLRRSA